VFANMALSKKAFGGGLWVGMAHLLGGWISTALAAPDIRVQAPHALRPGVAAVLQLQGSSLSGTRALWTSWTGVMDRQDGEGWDCRDDGVKVPVFVPAHLPPGIEAVRVLTTNGVSNLAWIWIDGLREAKLADDGARKRESAPLLHPPVAVHDTFVEGAVRQYSIRMNGGQRMGIEVVAQRMGSPSDPVLRVLNERGDECAYINDTPGLGSDCALEFEAPATGTYRIEVRDGEYAGGGNLTFRLRLGAFPVGVLAFPPVFGLAPGVGLGRLRLEWTSASPGREGVGEGEEKRSLADGPAMLRWAGLGGDGMGMCTPRLKVLDTWAPLEREPNNSIDGANEVGSMESSHDSRNARWDFKSSDGGRRSVGAGTGDSTEQASPFSFVGRVQVGRFDHASDVDFYHMTVQTTGWWRVAVQSRNLGLAADPRIRLMGTGNKVLASAAGGDPDPVLFHHFESPGDYWISLDEAGGRYGPARGYVLEIEPGALASRVSTEVERIQVPIGGKQTLPLKIEPRGYDGPLRVEMEGMPAGFEIENPEIEGRKKEWTLQLRCRSEVVAGTAASVRFRVRGKGDADGNQTEVDLGPARRKAFPRMLALPPGFVEGIWVAAVPQENSATSK